MFHARLAPAFQPTRWRRVGRDLAGPTRVGQGPVHAARGNPERQQARPRWARRAVTGQTSRGGISGAGAIRQPREIARTVVGAAPTGQQNEPLQHSGQGQAKAAL
eukprot:1367127-Pyramimonas_sp.AAC.1